MTPAAPTAYWRKLCEENFSRLMEDLEQQVETEVKSRVSAVLQRSTTEPVPDALSETPRGSAEALNQAVRRLRNAAGIEDLYSVLLDVTVPFCDQAALFSVHEKRVRAERIRRHAGAQSGERLARLEIPTAQAAAFATASETRDPVIAMSAPGEISNALVGLFGHKPDERVYLFPLVVNEAVAGILYATGRVQAPLLELLSGVAGLQCHIFTLALDPPAGLGLAFGGQQRPSDQMVTISGAAPNGAPAETLTKTMGAEQHNAWRSLSRGEQHLHLAAQRFARVQVAEIRISKLDVLRSARETRDIYGALQSPIEAAREEFREKHMTSSPTMVDYLHLELVRSLANDDAILLGPNYPGPLV